MKEIREKIEDIVANTKGRINPAVIAYDLIGSMTEDEKLDFFQLAMTQYVRTRLAQLRHEPRVAPSTERGKAARRRRLKSFPINVPDVGYIRLMDATPEDLYAAASQIEMQMAGMMQHADSYRALAKEIESDGVNTVADLDEDVVRELLG